MRDLDPIMLEARIYRLEKEGGSSEELEKLKKYIEDLNNYETGEEIEIGNYFGEKLYRQCLEVPLSNFTTDDSKTKHFSVKTLIDKCKDIVKIRVNYSTSNYGYIRNEIQFTNLDTLNNSAWFTSQYYNGIIIKTYRPDGLAPLLEGVETVKMIAYYTKEA